MIARAMLVASIIFILFATAFDLRLSRPKPKVLIQYDPVDVIVKDQDRPCHIIKGVEQCW